MLRRNLLLILFALVYTLAVAAPVYAQGDQPPAPPPPPGDDPAAPVAPLPVDKDEDKPGSADLISQGSVTPSPWILVGGGIKVFATIQDALNAIGAQGLIPTDRAVHIDAGAFTEASVTLNGANAFLGQLQKMDGNCDIINRTCNTSDATKTVLTTDLTIKDTKTGFTLQGLTVNGAVIFSNNTGELQLRNLVVKNTAGNGITVNNQKGAITLDDVVSNGNTGYGAYLNNAGVFAPVSIRSSAFDGNGIASSTTTVASLTIVSKGAVLINGVSASNNNSDGVWVQTPNLLTVRNARFESNHKVVDGAITVANGHGFSLGPAETPSGISMDMVHANNNAGVGFYLRSRGNITLENLTVKSNADTGLLVCGALSCNTPTPGTASLLVKKSVFDLNRTGAVIYTSGPVTMMGATFNANSGGSGVEIYARGTVTLGNVEASRNDQDGARIEILGPGVRGDLVILAAPGILAFNYDDPETWNQVNQFMYNNKGSGLVAAVQGSITLNSVLAYRNGGYMYTVCHDITSPCPTGYGLALSTNHPNGAGVALNQVWAGANENAGLILNARGPVIWNVGNAHYNSQSHDWGEGGAYINNTWSPVAAPVTFIATSFHGNMKGPGLSVFSKGAITLIDLDGAQENDGDGILLDNRAGTAPVSVRGMKHYTPEAEIVMIWRNSGSGIVIQTRGAVTLSHLWAIENKGFGVLVDNCQLDTALGRCTGSGAVTITADEGWANKFNSNGRDGLHVRSSGHVSGRKIEANSNGGGGVILDNHFAPLAWGVTVTAGTFDNNRNGDGLAVLSRGAIVVTDVDARGNDLYHDEICLGCTVYERLVVSRAVSGDSYAFSVDVSQNILVEAYGFPEVGSYFSAHLELWRWNETSGAFELVEEWQSLELYYYSRYFEAGRYEFRIIGSTSNSHGNYVLSLSTPAQGPWHAQGANGLLLQNDFPGATGSITVRRVSATANNDVSNNSRAGLLALSNGSITVTNIKAAHNGYQGVLLVNKGGFQPVSVNATNWNIFVMNGREGLSVESRGAITVSDIWTTFQGTSAIVLKNLGSFAPITVTTSRPDRYNQIIGILGGLAVAAKGPIIINRVNAWGRNSSGAYINNCNYDYDAGKCNGTGSVTISNSKFGSGRYNGLDVESNGAISLSKVTSSNNSGDGAQLTNAFKGSTGSVSLRDVEFNENMTGVTVESNGTISVFNLQANHNWNGPGALLKNAFSGATGNVIVSGLGNSATFNRNDENGLEVRTNGTILLSQLHADDNKREGFHLESAKGPVVIINCTAERNQQNGLFVQAGQGDVTVFGFRAMGNGLGASVGANGSGVWLKAANGNIWVRGSAFIGNGAAGVRYYVPATRRLVLTTSVFSANNQNAVAGYGNLFRDPTL